MNRPLFDYAYHNVLSPEERADLPLKIARGDTLTEAQSWVFGLFKHSISPAELKALLECALNEKKREEQ